MAEFEKKKHAQDEFNKGNKYVANDGVQPATINNLVENSLYTEAFAESLASTPDTTNAAQVGTPSVELVDNPSAGITGAKKFKFSNLKGEQGAGYFRANVSLDTTATSVPSSNINWGLLTEASVSDSIVDNNGNVFAVTAKTAATSPSIPISYRTSIQGEAGDSIFIRYSASSNGANMTAAPAANTRYIGFYRGQSASNTASDYTWSQYVGKEISEVTIDEFSFVITYDDGTTSTAPLNTENCLVTYAVPSDEATAMTAYLVPSNADLNDYRGENYWGKTFYAVGSNTVQNTPVASIAFSLEVLRSGAFETVQRITMMAAGSTVYTRSVSDTTTTGGEGSWTAWTEVAEANGTYPDMTVGNSTNATNDGGGNNIASTYATQTALTSGLAGKANTSGSYPSLSVGTATNATNAANINTEAESSSPWSNSSVFLSSRTINTDTPTNNDRIWAMSRLLGWAPSSNSNGLLFVSAMYFSGEGTERGRCVTGSVIVDPPTRTLTILTGIDKGFKWNFTEDATTPLKFTAFGGATLPAQVTITVLGFLDAGDHTQQFADELGPQANKDDAI